MDPRPENAKQTARYARENLSFKLKDDLTLWLNNHSSAAPMLVPTWPRDRERVPVFLHWSDAVGPILGVAANEEEMLDFQHPHRLWFHIRVVSLCDATSADPVWFARKA